jgi:hypothetical protein
MTHISCQVGELISQKKERKNNHFSGTLGRKHSDLCKTFFFKSMDYIEYLSVSQFYFVSFELFRNH